MLRNRLHKCVGIALANLLPEKLGVKEEKELLHPVLSMEHVHYMIDKLYDLYEKRMAKSPRKEKVRQEGYFINIPETPEVHLAYMLGTFIVLLMAEPKEIWVNCFLSTPDGEELYYGNPVQGRLLKQILKEFPGLKLYNKESYYGSEETIQFINQNKNIKHVVELGVQTESFWRQRFYRKDIQVHMPTANYVWVNYSSVEKLQEDKKFLRFGRDCFEEVFSYECHYDKSMEAFSEDDCYVGLTYYIHRDWREFLHFAGAIGPAEPHPVFLFGDVKPDLAAMEEEGVKHSIYLIPESKFSTNYIYYNFMNLLRNYKEED